MAIHHTRTDFHIAVEGDRRTRLNTQTMLDVHGLALRLRVITLAPGKKNMCAHRIVPPGCPMRQLATTALVPVGTLIRCGDLQFRSHRRMHKGRRHGTQGYCRHMVMGNRNQAQPSGNEQPSHAVGHVLGRNMGAHKIYAEGPAAPLAPRISRNARVADQPSPGFSNTSF